MKQGPKRKKYLSAIRASLCILALTLILSVISAGAEGSAELTETEWTWDPGGTATFYGVFTLDGPDQSDAVLKLELETNEPEQSGEIVFTEINGKTIKIRKRSDTLIADLNGNGNENSFRGDWYLPGDTVSLNRAIIRFRAESAEGQLLASAELKVGTEEDKGSSSMGYLLDWAQRLKWIILIGACALWAAAIARNLVLKRKKR